MQDAAKCWAPFFARLWVAVSRLPDPGMIAGRGLPEFLTENSCFGEEGVGYRRILHAQEVCKAAVPG